MTDKFTVHLIGIGAATTVDIDNLPDAETVAKVTSRGNEDKPSKIMAVMNGGTICSIAVDGILYYPEKVE